VQLALNVFLINIIESLFAVVTSTEKQCLHVNPGKN